MDIVVFQRDNPKTRWVEGLTDAGTDFIDGYPGGPRMQVIDAGRIVLPMGEALLFIQSAHESGLRVDVGGRHF